MSTLRRLKNSLVQIGFLLLALIAAPAYAQEDIFSRVRYFANGFKEFQPFFLWFFFIAGIGLLGYAGFAMYEKAKPDSRSEMKWSGISVIFLASVLMISLTSTSDLISTSVFGKPSTRSSGLVN